MLEIEKKCVNTYSTLSADEFLEIPAVRTVPACSTPQTVRG
jgi:hypothetical protein